MCKIIGMLYSVVNFCIMIVFVMYFVIVVFLFVLFVFLLVMKYSSSFENCTIIGAFVFFVVSRYALIIGDIV